MVGGREAGASCTGGAQIHGICMKVSRLVGHAWDHFFLELEGSARFSLFFSVSPPLSCVLCA